MGARRRCAAAGCGDNITECDLAPFVAGDPDGHPEPLKSGNTQARAGRVRAAELPEVRSKLVTWREGDFVIANHKIALVIEDVGDSELYDPWGGRPVGLARVENGQMVEPNNLGELFLLTGRSTVITDSVSVINDGSNGEPAVIRARGKLHPLPLARCDSDRGACRGRVRRDRGVCTAGAHAGPFGTDSVRRHEPDLRHAVIAASGSVSARVTPSEA